MTWPYIKAIYHKQGNMYFGSDQDWSPEEQSRDACSCFSPAHASTCVAHAGLIGGEPYVSLAGKHACSCGSVTND
jgi:hypothetical protein